MVGCNAVHRLPLPLVAAARSFALVKLCFCLNKDEYIFGLWSKHILGLVNSGLLKKRDKAAKSRLVYTEVMIHSCFRAGIANKQQQQQNIEFTQK